MMSPMASFAKQAYILAFPDQAYFSDHIGTKYNLYVSQQKAFRRVLR